MRIRCATCWCLPFTTRPLDLQFKLPLFSGLRKSAAGAAGEELKPVNIVLVASKQDHGPGQHDYPAWQKKWKAMLDRVPQDTVSKVSRKSVGMAVAGPVERRRRGCVLLPWNHDWSCRRALPAD